MKDRIIHPFQKKDVHEIGEKASRLDLILVGGQALAVWMETFQVHANEEFVTDDIDFLGNLKSFKKLSKQLNTETHKAHQRELTSLLGQFYFPAKDANNANAFHKVDVIHKMYGFKADELDRISKDAMEIKVDNKIIKVISPHDLLRARVKNYAYLKDKQNLKSFNQLKYIFIVINKVIQTLSSKPESMDRANKYVEYVTKISRSNAGVACRKKGADFSLCLPTEDEFKSNSLWSDNFINKRLPYIQKQVCPLGDCPYKKVTIKP